MIDFVDFIQNAPVEGAIEFMLSQNDINISGYLGITMLHLSCARKDGLPLVELLLYLGADRDRKDIHNRTALDHA